VCSSDLKKETTIKSSSPSQNETKQGPDSPEQQKNVGIKPFDHLNSND
jgi:hypothetical protein